MRYALINSESRLVMYDDIEGGSTWEYPPELTLVAAEGFSPDLDHYEYSDYVYSNGEFTLDTERVLEREQNKSLEPFQAISMLVQKTDILEQLDDDELAHMGAYMAEWDPDNHQYAMGDKVQYNGIPYRVLQAHTSNAAYPPPDAVSLYAKILPGQGGDIGVWEQPGSTNPYMIGDKVHYPTINDPVYISTIDYNVYAPDVYGWALYEGE